MKEGRAGHAIVEVNLQQLGLACAAVGNLNTIKHCNTCECCPFSIYVTIAPKNGRRKKVKKTVKIVKVANNNKKLSKKRKILNIF